MMATSYFKIILFLIIVIWACASYSWRQPQRRWIRNDTPYRKTENVKIHKPKHVFSDMPTKIELNIYLKALKRVVEFSAANKNDIDLNYAFGLFLINVNLKSVIRHKHMIIPLLVLQPIRDLVKKNTELLKFFHNMVKKDKSAGNNQNKAIYSLFLNDTVWAERLDRSDAVFETEKNKSSFAQLQVMYRTWEQYTKHIFDWDRSAIPGPRQSDHCIAALAECSVQIVNFKPKCMLPEDCIHVLINGTDSGYALTHRLLFMMLARYGRGCSVFSPVTDRAITSKYCSDAFNEAQYIAMHQYGVIDLMMEEITFCSLEGHIDFLRRQWLSHALKHQTLQGCFASPSDVAKKKPVPPKTAARSWILAKNPQEQSIAGGQCNSHLTATCAGALAGAVRLIVTLTKFPTKKILVEN